MKTIEQRLKVGEDIKIKNGGFTGTDIYLMYGGMPQADRFSLVLAHIAGHPAWAYNLYFPISKREIQLEGGTLQIKSISEDEIWLAYTK